MKTTTAERVKNYNEVNNTYHITGIKKMTTEELGKELKAQGVI